MQGSFANLQCSVAAEIQFVFVEVRGSHQICELLWGYKALLQSYGALLQRYRALLQRKTWVFGMKADKSMYTRALRQINIYTPNTRKYTHTKMILSLMRIYTYIFFVFIFILLACITGNSSLEPLLKGLLAQIHIDLS